MTPERWRQIEDLYHSASALDAVARTTLLDSTCAGDADLREEVEALLDEDARAEGFLEGSALEEAAKSLAEDRGPSFLNRHIGGYQILSFVGAGGMGEVYRARDLKLERDVALKLFARTTAGGADFLRRVEQEARLASGLNHPNIVTIYSVGEDSDLLYIAMELVEGRTLRDYLASTSIDVAQALDMAVPLADALAFAHAAGIAHLDLKPENVMVRPDGLLKILDFGLAKRTDVASVSSEAHGTIRGTRGYMSPEQAAGRAAGPASDQYSFGVMLAELLSGPPTDGTAIPPSVQLIVDRCCAPNPGERYGSARDLATALRRARDDCSRPVGVMSRRRALWLGGAAAVSAGAGVATWQMWSPARGIGSLAVLPFLPASSDEDIEYLSDGVTESLIRGLSRLPSLKVTPRSTVFNFKGKPVDAREAGRLLTVDAVLTGTVARESERISIAAELVDVRTGAGLWRHTYDRPASRLLALEDEIASAIVNDGIRLHLSGEERGALARHLTDDPEVYELYLRAVHQHRKETERGYLNARGLLQKAVARDPRFALAYAELAGTYITMAVDGFERPADVRADVRRNVQQAMMLDPDLPSAHGEAASEAFFFDWNWRAAERAWQAAMQTRAGDIEPDSLMGYAFERWAVGRSDEALQLARRARELDFLSPGFAIREADFLFQTRQFDAAATLYEEVIHDEPDDPRTYFGLAEVHAARNRFDEAIEARREGHSTAGDDSLDGVFAVARGEAGYRQIVEASARLELDALRARSASGAYVSPLDLARAHARLGEKELAFSAIEAAFADRAPGLVFLKADESWTGLRADARFAAAVRRVGLP